MNNNNCKGNPIDNIISAKSPLGYHVTCSNNTWYNHIIEGHESLTGKETIVSKAISNPNCIYPSNSSEDRHVYFGSSTSNNLFTKVIVKKSSLTEAKIITAFECSSVKGNIKEGDILYVKSKL